MSGTPTIIFPDVLEDLKQWYIGHPLVSPLLAGRIFFKMPTNNPTPPFLRLYQSGGGVNELEDTPLDHPRISHEIWGTANTNYSALRQVEIALKSAFYHGQNVILNPAGSTFMHSGAIVTGIDAPDPDTGWPRRVVDALLHVRLSVPPYVP